MRGVLLASIAFGTTTSAAAQQGYSRITGVEPGRYDVKLSDRTGRVCIVRNIEMKEGAVFSIEEKQLTDCRR